MNGKAADDPHRRRQDVRDSGLDVASFDHCDISAEVGFVQPEVEVRSFQRWRVRSDVCSLKGQNETAEITLLNTVDTSRRVKTILRNTPRYSHDSLGHCESSIKEVEKQKRVFISHTWRADHQCDSDRHVAWTITQCTANAEEQTSLFRWMSKDYHAEVAKFAELSWFHRIAKPQLDAWCCFARHSWSGLLSSVCAVFDPHLPTGNVHLTKEPEVARQPRGMTLGSMRRKSAVAADRDVECTVWSRYTGTDIAAHCHHE